MQTLDMVIDPNNHTRWKHKWRLPKGRCVWVKLTSGWSTGRGLDREVEHMHEMDMRDFVTFALKNVRHSDARRPTLWDM